MSRRAQTKTPIARMPGSRTPRETLYDMRQQRDAANRLLMELAEQMKEAVGLLRDYARIYPSNSGRTIRFLKEVEEKYGVGVEHLAGSPRD